MSDHRIVFEIEAARLTRYFRILWCLPVVILLLAAAICLFRPGERHVLHPAVITMLTILAVTLLSAFVLAPLHVRSLEYWIEGTTLRINQGVLIRKLKSIPLDRVTDIQLVQGPLMRSCGVWSLQIQTAGSAQQAPEGTIWGPREPHSVRDTIVSMRDKAAFKSDTAT